jgi:TrmH family RNA methyltransferase
VAGKSYLDNLRVVLVETRNPLNIGAAARAMSNFGARTLRLVKPYDPSFRQARSAVGASDLLAKAEVFSSVAEAVGDCSLVVGTTAAARRQLDHPLKPLPDGARLIGKRLAGGPVALLFGSEKKGLSNDHFSHCHWLMRIPTVEEHGSMNLGQAVAVCLYELARRPGRAGVETRQKASANALERFTEYLLEDLRLSGYIKLKTAAVSEQKIRRMVRRLDMEELDAQLWLGMLRQIGWKLRSKGHD